MPADLSASVRSARRYRQANLRDFLPDNEVERILAAVDRDSKTGRGDYAVLLLAARYGLRPSDIRQLHLEDLNWRAGVLSLRQAKTGRPLILPLLPDVASAMVAYLQHGRPASADRHIFIRHRAPFEPFVPTNNLSEIVRPALQRAGDQRQL
jgi:integrase